MNGTQHIKRFGVLVMAAMLVVSGLAVAATVTTTVWQDGDDFSDWTLGTNASTTGDGGLELSDSASSSPYVNISNTEAVDKVRIETRNMSSGAEVRVYLETPLNTSADHVFNASQIDSNGTITIDVADSLHFSGDSPSNESWSGDLRVGMMEVSGDTTIESVSYLDSNTAPTADAGPNQTALQGDSVAFDGSGSTDSDGDTLSYSWDFDGDGTEDATGVSPTHSFSSTGTYTVELTVTDPDGASDTDTMTVTVEESTYEQTFDVTDANGSAVANATVDVTDDSTGTTVATLTTDDNGSAVATLADGNYSFDITADGFDSTNGSFAVSGAAQTHNVTLSPAHDITVNVVDSTGIAVENASVEFPDLNESATTDENGSAAFTGIAEGTHNVTVTGPDGDISVDDEIEVTENDTEFEVVLSEDTSGGGGWVGDNGDTTTYVFVGGGLLVVLLMFAALAGADP
ncbi:PKD domain-containing protein [Halorussus gelatinilyticus]|uniref:PKD domain-containing protein n=1 Tax=Halorussus gelatinilyticus TaxID=2937524 RepID=A0A8U0IQP5_9EURY|nr:PKD domain-containing protein [Halorussus gelatinilyticus]UPW02384.1 PKD domain-containing protein [Halorussus gelatinilyticus]